MSGEFWLMTIVYLIFIAFASILTYWGGYPAYSLFWIICGVVGVGVLVYLYRRNASRQG